MRPTDIIEILLQGVRELHGAEDQDEAFRAFRDVLSQMGIENSLLLIQESRGGRSRLAPAFSYSLGEQWVARLVAQKSSYEATLARLSSAASAATAQTIETDAPEIGPAERDLYRRSRIAKLFVAPLRTASRTLGVVQVGFKAAPKPSLTHMIEALCTHLATLLERLELKAQQDEVEQQLVNQGRQIAYEAAAAAIMHQLKHRMLDYLLKLRRRENEFRTGQNRVAVELLRDFEKKVRQWADDLAKNITSLREQDEPRRHPAGRLVESIVRRHRDRARLRRCKIKGSVRCDASIEVREGVMEEVFSCLITNAFEAHADEIEIVVRDCKARETSLAEDEGPDARCVMISVRDTGGGLAEADIERLFEVGFTTKPRVGHGVGLTLARLLTRQEGGELELRSAGKSAGRDRTEFAVVFPLDTA